MSIMNDHTVVSSEDSSSYPDEEDEEFGLELGLGLSLGAAHRIRDRCSGGTAMSIDSSSSTSSSSSSSFSRTKRPAESEPERSSPPRSAAVRRQVIGWPPVRTHRINCLGSQMKQAAADESAMVQNSDFSSNPVGAKDQKPPKTSFFVKVNMDGIPIGRKVDLNAHSCYQNLSLTLDKMFTAAAEGGAGSTRINVDGKDVMAGPCFSLTYEDKEGDWMLVGDVPWEVFLKSVKRLRIRRATKHNPK